MLEQLAKKGRKLAWKEDRVSGAWHLEGTDYAIHTDPATGARIAVRGSEHLGTFRELPEAKDVIEKEVARLRSEGLQNERRAQTAATGGDPFMEAIGEAPGSRRCEGYARRDAAGGVEGADRRGTGQSQTVRLRR